MYPSDISDKEWEILEPYVAQGAIGRPRKHDIRAIINAIRYIMKGGCQWRMLPKDFPPWKTVYDHYFRWRNNGKLQRIHDSLVKKSISKNDSKRGSRGYDAGKKIKGRKRHIIVDTLGLVVTADVHSAGVQDRDGALALLIKAKRKTLTLQRFFADQGYTGELQKRCFLKTGCLLTIAKKDPEAEGFQVIPKRWIVERTFAWLSNFRRMSKDYEHSPLTSKTNIFFNMITIMLKN
ncbi:Transposase, IS4-like,Putative transposase IS4/IS5 family [Cinara cedri]|uniref:Transposase, IS4-like,Putative transposase IS4/IS5 family n=1 Tax=Cinara cedri TaxID=506608 RepID=A0A5E4MS23_9HEMI|nr:Transposase, IS4-like,Putative transposase IS4/IS5 family [Cinara cedri]